MQEFSKKFGSAVRRWLWAKELSALSPLSTYAEASYGFNMDSLATTSSEKDCGPYLEIKAQLEHLVHEQPEIRPSAPMIRHSYPNGKVARYTGA